jgi:hypothetical protein
MGFFIMLCAIPAVLISGFLGMHLHINCGLTSQPAHWALGVGGGVIVGACLASGIFLQFG